MEACHKNEDTDFELLIFQGNYCQDFGSVHFNIKYCLQIQILDIGCDFE